MTRTDFPDHVETWSTPTTTWHPANPSQKQHNCEHPYFPLCERPASRYISGRKVRFFCDEHAPKREVR